MPNVGRPSTGCFACRQMKVRCDERKPFCSRCTRAKRSCPGYADNFLYEEPATRGRRGRRTNHTDSDSMCGKHASPDKRCVGRPVRTTTGDWYDRAHRYFFHTHTVATSEYTSQSHDHLNLLESYCFSDGPESYLKQALQAVSLLTLSRRVLQFEWMITKAMCHYTQALRGIQLALSKAAGTSKDDILIALWCIEKIELINGLQETTQVHSAGISAIINHRGHSQLSSELGKQIFYTLNLQLVARDCIFGTRFHHPVDASHPLAFHLYSNTARLTAECRAILTGQSETPIESLTHGANAQINELRLISPDLPLAKHYIDLKLGLFQMVARYFERTVDAVPWLYYHMMKLRTLRIVQLGSNASESVAEDIKTEALAIASLIPALLGHDLYGTLGPPGNRFGIAAAILAMHACSSVMSSTELDEPDLRQWILHQYTYIGNTYGIKEAFAFRNYFLSGTAMSDIQTIWTVARGNFPRLAPIYMTGQERKT